MKGKHMKKANYSLQKLFGLFLFILLLSTITGLQAMYFTKLGGESTGTVAKFDVSLVGQSDTNLSLDGIEEQPVAEYNFQITNDGEVATNCDVVLNLNETLQDAIIVSLINEKKEVYTPEISEDRKTFSFSNVGIVDMGKTGTFNIRFSAEKHGDIVLNQNIEFDVDVNITQED